MRMLRCMCGVTEMDKIRNERIRGIQGSYNNEELKFQYIPGWIELNFQDISDVVGPMSCSHVFFFAVFGGAFSSYSKQN